MTKALLSRRGVEFDDHNVAADPSAMEELRAVGIMSVPAVIVGDRSMSGWNPTKLAELVGIAHQERVVPPDELVETVRTVLDGAIRAAGQVPEDRWEMKHPRRDRPLRELTRHLFQVVEVSVDADVLGVFPAKLWLQELDVPLMTGGARLVRYGEAVRAKFDTWYTVVEPDRFARTIGADVGPRTLNQVLERTRLHAAQHLRQVYQFLEMCGVQPERPVTDDDLQRFGLEQLPDEVF